MDRRLFMKYLCSGCISLWMYPQQLFWQLFGPLALQFEKRTNPHGMWSYGCPHCGYYIDSFNDDKVLDGGEGWGEWGRSWWVHLEKTCARCAYKWEYMDGGP